MLNFENTETAFVTKDNEQLKKAYWLFKLVANKGLVGFGKTATSIAMTFGLPIRGIVKKTVYDQFVGGETIMECRKIIELLLSHRIHSILDYSVEGKKTEREFDLTTSKIIDTIRYGSEHDGVPISVFKVTGLARFELLAKVTSQAKLNDRENEEWNRVQERVDKICHFAFENDIRVLIDAEESWIQGAIDHLADQMMAKYNSKKVIVFNTFQLYRWDRLQFLKDSYKKAIEGNYHLGAKLVRGAYMEKERARAYNMEYKSPIQADKESTDRDFDAALQYVIENKIGLVAGSHNQESTQLLVDLMEKAGLKKDDPNIWFSQLYGMSDHLSFNLAKEGYNVIKYLPFGPVKETLPYLIRRAEENSSASGQTGRELSLIRMEMKRRGMK